MNETHVFISSGGNVHLPCNNALHDCKSTTWNYDRVRDSGTVELIARGIKKKDMKSHKRLSLGSDCSLNIKNVKKEDYGSYSCRQYVNYNQEGTDARVFLHVLHGNFMIMWSIELRRLTSRNLNSPILAGNQKSARAAVALVSTLVEQ